MKILKYKKQKIVKKEIKIEKLKSIGKQIVFTNGCFDLIHLGHIVLLEKAKSFGDILIVAINSDKSLSNLKGAKRPLVKENERAKILLSLKFVDYVIIFDEQTPENILEKLRPDILVKGQDYEFSEIVGRKYVKKIYRVPIVKNKSTTNLINLIVKRYSYK
ncbi:MAG: adenylyltransferase/cytidyltransferase family protein [Endomicrobium sp.]|jgi:D-beta-D-heptose 7-phosphate kinase/D-beta-D-heptose 1-phosphate adenosyltransferase|nr:adenylyltransferase/cytidyltransferase family protein [Endomicrobium sp.]